MNEELPELVKELPKIGDDIKAARPDVSEEVASNIFDILAHEKDTTAMAAAYDMQSKESIDVSISNDELEGLPIHQMLSFEDVLASVKNDFASIIQMENENKKATK